MIQPDSMARQGPVPIFVSVELSRVQWLVTWTFHGSTRMSKTFARAGGGEGLLALLAQIRTRAGRAQHLAGEIIRAKAQARRLGGPPREDCAVGQSLLLQGAMAPADEFLRPLVEKGEDLLDQPGRLRVNRLDRAR